MCISSLRSSSGWGQHGFLRNGGPEWPQPVTLALPRAGYSRINSLTHPPERVALWQAPVPRRWPGPGCNAQPPTARREIVFLVKPRKFNSGWRECRPLKASLKPAYPSFF